MVLTEPRVGAPMANSPDRPNALRAARCRPSHASQNSAGGRSDREPLRKTERRPTTQSPRTRRSSTRQDDDLQALGRWPGASRNESHLAPPRRPELAPPPSDRDRTVRALSESGREVAEGMGSRVELFEQIRRDRDREGLRIRALAARHGVHRRAVRQALASPLRPVKRPPLSRPAPKLARIGR